LTQLAIIQLISEQNEWNEEENEYKKNQIKIIKKTDLRVTK
jgi:hypothetical protein